MMSSLRPKLAVTTMVVMLVAWAALSFTMRQTDRGIVRIGDAIMVRVDIAATPVARAQGLSGRASLAEDEGMLFLFEFSDRHAFWMKDMRFPLDFIWINEGEIVDMTVDVPPPSGPETALPTVAPFVPADAVLEVPAGFAARHGLRIGEVVSWAVDR